MKRLLTIDEVRAALAPNRADKTIAFVPTMGFLHEGHLALVRRARSLADIVIASIFVNPTQFERADDLAAYPMDIEGDCEKLAAEGVDFVFIPSKDDIYPAGASTVVSVGQMSKILMGAIRPGHFDGVTTIVSKLFHIVMPDYAVFGEKDYQQLAIIRKMVADLNFPLEIVGVSTERADDGLALSSRNVRLSPEARNDAVVLSESLRAAQNALNGGVRDVHNLRNVVKKVIESSKIAEIRAIDIVNAEDLSEISDKLPSKLAILLAVAFGDVLLIDQAEFNLGDMK